MSTLKTTNIAHPSSASNNIVLDSSGRALVGVSSANANGGILQLSSGITFPATQVLSTDPNTLDDYEEGTWTPTLGGTATYTVQTGTYTKIGRLVYVSAMLTVNTIGTGATKQIDGLPFSINGSNNDIGAAIGFVSSAANSYVSIGVDAFITSIVLDARTAAATGSAGSAFFGNGTAVRLTMMYFT